MLEVNNKNTRIRCEICSTLTIKTQKRCQWRHSSIFIVNFEHISTPCSSVSIVNFEQENDGWDADGWLHFMKWFLTISCIKQVFIIQILKTRNSCFFLL